MEQRLPPLASGPNAAATAAATTPLYLTLDNAAASPPSTSLPSPPPPASERAAAHDRGADTIKAKIMSHRLYPALLRAFIECQKVGAPPEVVGRLSSLAGELESHPDDGRQQEPSDPELDEFMETYCDVLVRYRQELTRPIQEADEFFRAMEAQMESFAIEDNSGEGGGSSEDEQEAAGVDAAGLPEIAGPCAEDKELKSRLLSKYSGYLSSLWRDLSKKKKKGKLPRDARQKLLHWWQLHYRWPYPSEVEKAALAESTGLDAKQINNWFINQRKRHWKPTPAVTADYRLQPPYGGASSSSSATFRMDGNYFPGGGPYPRGP